MELLGARGQGVLPALDSVAIIGCGGVGSWVGFLLGIHGVNKLVLVDHDVVTNSNLNRTPYRPSQIEKPKVECLRELIFERRPLVVVRTFQATIQSLTKEDLKEVSSSEVILDCRDNASALPPSVASKVKLWVGYDGLNFTLHLNPYRDDVSKSKVVELATGYQIASVLPTTLLVASLYVSFTLLMKKYRIDANELPERFATYSLESFLDKALGVSIFSKGE